jgi:subtilisin-like proprotein convertase family protein
MAADYLLWVRDAESALLMEWTGKAWAYRTALTAGEQYQFDAARNDCQTDLLLPFETISVTQPASATLGLVAFAERDGTPTTAGAVWAALPNANPIHNGEGGPLQLTHTYHWDGLGAGACPNGSDGSATAYLDIEGVSTLVADPIGRAATEMTPTVTSGAGLTPVGNGQTIPYTFTYRNRGTVTATGLLLDLAASGALRLVGGNQLYLEDVPPGGKTTLRFDGIVDTALGGEQALVEARIYAAAAPSGPPLDRRWLAHPVDGDPPVFFGLQAPGYLIGVGEVSLRGYAHDESGVTEMWVELRPDGGLTKTLTCPDARPHDGRWTCTWDASGFSDGAEIAVRLRAIDSFGQVGTWSTWQPLRVDAVPPMVTLDAAATGVISGSLVQESTFTLVGDVTDAGGVDEVQVCGDDGACEQAVFAPQDALSALTVEDVPTETIPIDASVACGGGEITRTFWVSESFAIGQVTLGFNAVHERRVDLVVVLESPAGTQVQVLGGDDTQVTVYDNYAVSLDDTASAGLFDARGDDTLAQVYGRRARPYQPLRAFRGEDAAGWWTLYICDAVPDQYDGVYRRSRLTLVPWHGAATAGRWMAQMSVGDAPLDYVRRTFTVSAVDVVGNRSRDRRTGTLMWDFTQRLGLWVDNVAPAITVTGITTGTVLLPPQEIVKKVELGKMTTVLSGTVSDGGPAIQVFAHLRMPNGEIEKRHAARDGAHWWFDWQLLINGEYTLWVNASDLAGNAISVGPFKMTTRRFLYMPLVVRNVGEDQEEQVHLYLPLVLRASRARR